MPNQSPTITGRRWYYADAEQQTVGPLTEDHLRLLRQNGAITDDTLIVPEGSDEWTPYSAVFSDEAVQPPPLPAHANEAVPPTKPCSFCAEPISLAAKKCKHCGEMLDHSLRAAQQAGRNVHVSQPKKMGCLKMLGMLFLLFFAFSAIKGLFVSQPSSRSSTLSSPSSPPPPRPIFSAARPTPQAQPPEARSEATAPRASSTEQSSRSRSSDFQNGAVAGEALGKEMAAQEGGRPYPQGIEMMAKARLDEAKPGSRREWLKGFEAGFTQGWDSIRGSRNAENYKALTWETAQTGALLYDIDERHRATLITPDRETGEILVRYVEKGSIERKDLKEMALFWFVRKEPPSAPKLSKLQPSDIPKHVSLKSEIVFELPEGKGTATAPSGTQVELVKRSHDKLRIRFMGAEKEVPTQETNFEEEVQTAFSRKQQQERQEIERLAALEKAKLDAKEAEAKALRAKIVADAGKEPGDTAARVLVRLYLERKLNDPSSVKYESWSKVQYTEYSDGKYAWCITVTYRAKNAFGAYMRNQSTGYIRNERLISFE